MKSGILQDPLEVGHTLKCVHSFKLTVKSGIGDEHP